MLRFLVSYFGPVPSKDMQTPPALKSCQIFMKDAECAETNEKINFPIFIFRVMVIFVLKIWLIFDEFSLITRKIRNGKNVISFFILFSTFLIFHTNLADSEGSVYPWFGKCQI